MSYSQPLCPTLRDRQTPQNLLYFDARKLAMLGISPGEADAIAQMLTTKQTLLHYWRKLAQAGVPKDDARRVARAIARYDVKQVLPDAQQQNLIRYYCPIVCRCGLWRSALLLERG